MQLNTHIKVKDVLVDLGLTQQELADFTGIPRDRIGKWVQGKGNPKAEDAAKLKALHSQLTGKSSQFIQERLLEARQGQGDRIGENTENYIDNKTLKPVQLFNNQVDSVNLDFFHSLIPTIDNRKSWVPYFSSLDRFLSQYPSTETLEKDGLKNYWPMIALPDEIYRLPNTASDLMITAPALDNMYPFILPLARITIKFVEKDMVFFGPIPYLVVFNNNEFRVSYIEAGKDENHWLLKNHNERHAEKQIHVDKIKLVFVVKTAISQTA